MSAGKEGDPCLHHTRLSSASALSHRLDSAINRSSSLAKELGISRSCLQNWLAQADADEKNGTQGRLTTAEKAELRRKNRRLALGLGLGLGMNRKRVERFMCQARSQGVYRWRGRRNPVIVATEEDLVGRAFAVQALDRLWLTDITEHPMGGGKLYCVAVMDAYSCRIVGWSMDERQTTELVVNALSMAVTRRAPENGSTVLHSDHGCW